MSRSVAKVLSRRWWEIPRYVDHSSTTYIKVSGLSRTATPTDLRRACVKAGIENIASVTINYSRFTPVQEGFISLTHPTFVHNAVKALSNTTIGGFPIQVGPVDEPRLHRTLRTRGLKGRAEAAERGVVTGDGPAAGITQPGKNVIIYGLPPKTTPFGLKKYLNDFSLADSLENGEQEIVKLETAEHALTTKYLVRLSSASDAHRLVRQLHMTPFSKENWGRKYRTKVRVIS